MTDQTEHFEQPVGGDQVFCSHCGTENAKGSYACNRCGERLLVITTETASPMGLVSCPRCGGANNTRAVYCWVCGSEMNDAVRISPVPKSEPRRVATKFQPDLNPISVPTPASEPKDERSDLRGPAPGSSTGGSASPGAGPTKMPDGMATVDEPAANTSGTKNGVVPREIKGWNWAAFLMPAIWGVFSGVPYSALLFGVAFLPPGIQIFVIIGAGLFLGSRGNELAWRGKKWRSVEHFKSVQKQWTTWAVTLTLVVAVLFFLLVLPQSGS